MLRMVVPTFTSNVSLSRFARHRCGAGPSQCHGSLTAAETLNKFRLIRFRFLIQGDRVELLMQQCRQFRLLC